MLIIPSRVVFFYMVSCSPLCRINWISRFFPSPPASLQNSWGFKERRVTNVVVVIDFVFARQGLRVASRSSATKTSSNDTVWWHLINSLHNNPFPLSCFLFYFSSFDVYRPFTRKSHKISTVFDSHSHSNLFLILILILILILHLILSWS